MIRLLVKAGILKVLAKFTAFSLSGQTFDVWRVITFNYYVLFTNDNLLWFPSLLSYCSSL